MSKYTTQVRFICENYAGVSESVGYGKVDEIIASARKKVFDFSYPIFDETYRSVLETKILKHFYTREIGAETVGLWKFWLNTKMNEIMPYYNQLYKSELLEFNPFYDVDITREHSGSKEDKKQGNKTETKEETRTNTREEEKSGTINTKEDNTENKEKTIAETIGITGERSGDETLNKSETTNSSKDSNDYYSDTPQGGINNLDNLTYLTNARKINDSGATNITGNSTNNVTSKYTEDSTTNGTNSEENTSTTTVNNTENYTVNISENFSDKYSGGSTEGFTQNSLEDYLEKVSGKQGGASYSKLLEEYRSTFLNIDMQVISELNDLFINLW